jgi:hypothetical protein
MAIFKSNSVFRGGKTIALGKVCIVVKCDEADCEYVNTSAATLDQAKEIEVAHYRVAHKEKHADKVWERHGRRLRLGALS